MLIVQEKEGKGRSFEALALSWVTADRLWEGGFTSDNIRPIWLMFTASDEQIRAFSANLITGRKADIYGLSETVSTWSRRKPERLELLKSSGYQLTAQKLGNGSTIMTAFLPDLFRLDPGMVDPEGINFCILPSKEWLGRQTVDSITPVRHMLQLDPKCDLEIILSLVTLSYLFAAYLDRRTRCPLINDPRFYLQLLCACLEVGLATLSGAKPYSNSTWGRHSMFKFEEYNTEAVGLLPGLAFKASHADLEKVLSDQTALYFELLDTVDVKRAANG